MSAEWVDVIHVECKVSRHNSDRDESDDALVDGLRERIKGLVGEPQYAKLQVMY